MTQEIKVLLGIGIATLIVFAGAVFMLSKTSPNPSTNEINVGADNPHLVRENSDKIATESAKINIVEFGDYECPSCAAAHSTIKKILQNYSGKINFVFRNFPLPQHPFGMTAAKAAEAAGEQGKFWQMHDMLYEKQNEWSISSQPAEQFKNYAKDLGFDTAKFESDVNSNKYDQKIQRDIADGNVLGVDATPTFFINGLKISGAPSYEEFSKLIDTELSK